MKLYIKVSYKYSRVPGYIHVLSMITKIANATVIYDINF